MSGYPPPDLTAGFPVNQPPYSAGNQPTGYPPNSGAFPAPGYPSNPSYPYPNQNQPSNMSGDHSGYPGAGYPSPQPSQPYPNAGGYPSAGGYPATSPNAGGYPATSPNAGGYPGPSPNAGGFPPPGNVPAAGFNPEVCPTAPDLSQIEKIPGYERLTFDEEIIMPPAMPDWQPDIQDRKQVTNLPTLSEEDAREAVIQYVSEHCCYGSRPAKNMVITNITMMSAFHYKLETFGEKRESAWRFEPYRGQPIDGPMNGPAPTPWDVVITPPALFMDGKTKLEVPHTAFVKPCHTCVGNGRVRCDSCKGNGRDNCTWCRGRGTRSNFDNEQCSSCHGTGFSRCTWCSATGQVECKTCRGKGQLKGYVELIVTWTNHVDDYISETSSMPKELVRQVTGQVAIEEEYPRVHPILHAPDEAVRNASSEFVAKHNSAFPNERILKQRHCLRLIPIGEINYQWSEKGGVYYVYGYEHKVYFHKYPQRCCCCTIM